MGSCISKFKPKRENQQVFNHVQDKLVISQPPISSTSLSSTKQPLSPTKSPASTSSVSSFSCTNSNTSSSLSLSSSLSSSSICTKERSFSNEFLWSCVKKNPHIIHNDQIKGSLQKPVPTRAHVQKPSVARVKQSIDSIPPRRVTSIAQKRGCASSPTLTQKKSFRREPERPNSTYYLPSRALRSPSPSRRFSGGLTNSAKESCCKSWAASKAHAMNSGLSFVKKENVRPASPINNSSRHGTCLMNREMCSYRIGSKIDEIVVGKVLSNQDIEAIPMEDIHNPLIALDCFIFL
ncbi:hypothetical protein LOK49_LG05G02488 [Camellia lanceoleosa]|uniref:Uncharacterized protein n=1 Tax=Camellia lanceoleosa TaxID=1840588 RepID=A0ACC0HRH8_9ERIC|nr:hypothetical protein LOK49_LG05G02488 [Camellia lanceoleosa]